MLTFERTSDLDLVRRIMTHPRVYPFISDDGCPPAEQFAAPEHPAIWYVLVHSGAELLGLYMFVPQGAACWEVHTCLLPRAWGELAAAAARGAAEWIWRNTACRRIVTSVPAFNRLALRYAERAGMTRYGVNPASYLKNGKLYDQVLLGISKPEEN